MRRHALHIAVVTCLASGGCSYVKNRANDLLDTFRLDVGFTPGLYVEARATDFAALGVGLSGRKMVGLHGRYTIDYSGLKLGLGPFILGEMNFVDASPVLAAASTYSRDHGMMPGQLLFIPRYAVERPPAWSLERRGWNAADLGAQASLGLVGASVGFSPGELLDLLLGFVGVDIVGDDVFGRDPAAEDPASRPREAPAAAASQPTK